MTTDQQHYDEIVNELKNYIELKIGDVPGWKSKYEHDIMSRFEGKDNPNYAFLSGHYSTLLDELINIIGRDIFYNIISTNNEMAERMAKRGK